MKSKAMLKAFYILLVLLGFFSLNCDLSALQASVCLTQVNTAPSTVLDHNRLSLFCSAVPKALNAVEARDVEITWKLAKGFTHCAL